MKLFGILCSVKGTKIKKGKKTTTMEIQRVLCNCRCRGIGNDSAWKNKLNKNKLNVDNEIFFAWGFKKIDFRSPSSARVINASSTIVKMDVCSEARIQNIVEIFRSSLIHINYDNLRGYQRNFKVIFIDNQALYGKMLFHLFNFPLQMESPVTRHPV